MNLINLNHINLFSQSYVGDFGLQISGLIFIWFVSRILKMSKIIQTQFLLLNYQYFNNICIFWLFLCAINMMKPVRIQGACEQLSLANWQSQQMYKSISLIFSKL